MSRTTFDFKVSAPLKVEAPKDVWRLHTNAMSGDADHYEHQTADFKHVSELSRYFALLNAFCGLEWNEGCHDVPVENAIMAEARNQRLDPNEAYEWYTDFVGRDVTYEEGLARPDDVWVTYFDEQGAESSVTVNGKKQIERTQPIK